MEKEYIRTERILSTIASFSDQNSFFSGLFLREYSVDLKLSRPENEIGIEKQQVSSTQGPV